jgi:hypothetical protein
MLATRLPEPLKDQLVTRRAHHQAALLGLDVLDRFAMLGARMLGFALRAWPLHGNFLTGS